LKPEYEKPTAVPLGEAAKGSGQCNAGSAVMPSTGVGSCYGGSNDGGNCNVGNSPTYCYPGGVAAQSCGQGNTTLTYLCDCSQGLYPRG
jgi:hypothetical protein